MSLSPWLLAGPAPRRAAAAGLLLLAGCGPAGPQWRHLGVQFARGDAFLVDDGEIAWVEAFEGELWRVRTDGAVNEGYVAIDWLLDLRGERAISFDVDTGSVVLHAVEADDLPELVRFPWADAQDARVAGSGLVVRTDCALAWRAGPADADVPVPCDLGDWTVEGEVAWLTGYPVVRATPGGAVDLPFGADFVVAVDANSVIAARGDQLLLWDGALAWELTLSGAVAALARAPGGDDVLVSLESDRGGEIVHVSAAGEVVGTLNTPSAPTALRAARDGEVFAAKATPDWHFFAF